MPNAFACILGLAAAGIAAAQNYQLRLTPLVHPPNNATGLLLKTSLNGGPQLRLLLDSGAEFLTLDRRAAKRSGIVESGALFELVGAGSNTRQARMATADSVTAGDLTLRKCPVMLVEGRVAEGIDGVIPLASFAAYEIDLDVPGRMLHLKQPLRGAAGAGFVPARLQHNLLFIAVPEGYLLLDTGSSFNVISDACATALRQPKGLAASMNVSSGTGDAIARVLTTGIRFEVGGQSLRFDPAAVVDLGELSRRHGFKLAGAIGYPALANARLTIDYARALVRIESR